MNFLDDAAASLACKWSPNVVFELHGGGANSRDLRQAAETTTMPGGRSVENRISGTDLDRL